MKNSLSFCGHLVAPKTSALALVASLGLIAACGGESPNRDADALPVAGPSGGDATTQTARFTGHVSDGHLVLSPVSATSQGAPGVTPQGFGEFLSGTLYFETTGDGLGYGSCDETEYCADVTAENGTDYTMDNVYAEITNYYGVTPPGAAVVWAGPPFPKSATYGNFFVHSSNIQAGSYDSIEAGEVKNAEWKFDLNAGSPEATSFGFDVAVYASFRRTQSVSQQYQRGQDAVDACAASLGTPQYLSGQDDAQQNIDLPFPYTFGDITYDRAVIGSNGYVLFFQDGDAAPSAPVTNAAVTAGSTPIGYYPFWDDLAFDAGAGVCTTTAGTKPNRLFTITWRQAKINTSPGQASKGTWSAERVTYSLVLQETSDTAIFSYNLPTGGAGVTNVTRGSTATIGERAIRGGVAVGAQNSFNMVSTRIPTATTDYAARIFRQQSPANPSL